MMLIRRRSRPRDACAVGSEVGTGFGRAAFHFFTIAGIFLWNGGFSEESGSSGSVPSSNLNHAFDLRHRRNGVKWP